MVPWCAGGAAIGVVTRRVFSFAFLYTMLRCAPVCCRSVYAAVTLSAECLAVVVFDDARGVVFFPGVGVLIAPLRSADLKPLLVLTAALSCASEMAQEGFLLLVVFGTADEDETWWG